MQSTLINFNRVASLIIVLCGLLVLFLGFFTFLGYQPSLRVIQLQNTHSSMVYDSALGFFIAGIGLIFSLFKNKFFTFIAGFVLLLIGLSNFVQYLFDQNWHLSESILSLFINLNDATSGKMEFITAILFSILGLAFWLMVKDKLDSKKSILIGGAIGVICLVFGLLHLFGYTFIPDTTTSERFNLLSLMPINTAIGFIVLGIGFIFFAIYRAKNKTYSFDKITAIYTATAVGCLSLIFWRWAITQQYLENSPPESTGLLFLKEIFFGIMLGMIVYFLQRNIFHIKNYKRSNAIMKATLEATSEGIQVLNKNGEVVASNKKLLSMWNIPYKLSKERDPRKILDFALTQVKNKTEFMDILVESYNDPTKSSFVEIQLNNGSFYEMYSVPQKLKKRTIGRIYSFHDVTHLKNAENKLMYYATHDILTGLANRFILLQRIKQSLNDGRNQGTLIAILFFDLDRFKLVNDSLGHTIGDLLLKAVATRLRQRTRKQDTLARLGGDEFVALITGIKHKSNITSLANKYISSFLEPFQVDHHKLFLYCSLGISLYPEHGNSPETLLENADLAMYRAKARKKRYQIYNPEMHRQIITQLSIENELPHALGKNQFIVFYQPIIDLKRRRISSLEALIRWHHPTLGFKSPGDFIPIAERIGIMPDIGEWVLTTACKQFQIWTEQGLKIGNCVCVNISENQLRQPLFFETITKVLQKLNFNPKHLELELSEEMLLDPLNDIADTLNKLKNLGITVSIDDFGIGQSSLNLLKQLPIDRLKIDKSFVENLPTNEASKAIFKAFLQIGEALKLQIVAEGIGTKEQLDFLINHHCNYIQGYYFSKPMDVQEVEADIDKIYLKIHDV